MLTRSPAACEATVCGSEERKAVGKRQERRQGHDNYPVNIRVTLGIYLGNIRVILGVILGNIRVILGLYWVVLGLYQQAQVAPIPILLPAYPI